MKSFLFAFVVCFLALVSLFAIVDTFANLSNLVGTLAAGARSGFGGGPETGGTLARFFKQFVQVLEMIFEMNAARMPLIFYELVPSITLSAAMFTIARMRKANEITPLLASGVSMYRIVWPIFLMALAVTVVQVLDREMVIPKYSQELYDWDRVRNENLVRYRRQAMMQDVYGNVIFAGKYELATQTQHGALFTRYWPAQTVEAPMVIVNAQEAKWQRRPARGWIYSTGQVVEYDASGNIRRQVPFGEAGFFIPLVVGGKKPANYEVVTDATPERLETEEVDIFYRPTLYLLQYMHDHGLRADIALDLNKRLSIPLSNIVLLLLGLPFVLKRDVRSPFLAIVVAVMITLGYIALGLVTENFALEGRILTPLTGAWAPIIIFGPLGVLLFDSVES